MLHSSAMNECDFILAISSETGKNDEIIESILSIKYTSDVLRLSVFLGKYAVICTYVYVV